MHSTYSPAPNPDPLPILQQPPFRYVDTVEHLDCASRRAVLRLDLHSGQHRWGADEALPGFLLIEAMAQAAGVLIRRVTEGSPGGLLVGIDQARLPSEIRFPAALKLHAQLSTAASPFFNVNVQVLDDGAEALASAALQVMSHRRLIA